MIARLLLVVGGLAAGLAAAEVAVRVAGVSTPLYFGTDEEGCMVRSALLGVELRPRCTGTIARTAFRTNALGLRGPEVEPAPFPILALGDSCTWGYQVGDDATYPALLQYLLDRRAGAGRYRVLNAGVPGWTSHQGVLYLSERGLALEPRLVILAFQFNDGFGLGDIETELARARRILPLLRVDDALLARSLLYRWTRFMLADPFRVGTTPRVSPDKHRANLERLIDLAHEHGAHAAIVDWNFAALPRYREAERAVAEERRVPRVVYDGARVDLIHPDAAGYAALAGRLVRALDRAGYLPW